MKHRQTLSLLWKKITSLVLLTALAHTALAAEIPYLMTSVKEGLLPTMSDRIPENPRVITLSGRQQSGQYGGRLKTLMAKENDIRLMTVYGYARLVGYDRSLNLVPDILERVQIKEERDFILTLRRGHRWSDGEPFTAEDFRYWWEDMANNRALYPTGIPKAMLVDDKPPEFTVINEYQVRYRWAKPNPVFLPALAAPRPLYIYAPSHYLKQFHQRYADPQQLETRVKEKRLRNWASLHQRHAHQYKNDNPQLPTLQPWVNTTAQPAERFLFVRNPYFHRVDQLGRQLPYIDEVQINIVSSSLIPAKVSSGESDLQARYISMDQWPFLKEGEKERGDYQVLPWKVARGAQLAIYPNQNCKDPVWRKLLQDVRFRRALSLGVNRHEINQVIYFGLATESANTLLPVSPLYQPELVKRWSAFDLHKANQILDELGLAWSPEGDLRTLADGRPLELVVHSAGESREQEDIFELIQDHWQALGLKAFLRNSQREVFRRRITSGDACMSLWVGLDNAQASAEMPPFELAPTAVDQLQWPLWGLYYSSAGARGQAPATDTAKRLQTLNHDWLTTEKSSARQQIWREMLRVYDDDVISIGTVNQVIQPVIRAANLHNVPDEAYYGWQPTAYFGVYNPDTFFFLGRKKND